MHNPEDCPYCDPPRPHPKPPKSWIVMVPSPNGPRFLVYYGENAAKEAAEAAAIANRAPVRVFESTAVVSPRPESSPVIWEDFK